MPSPCTCTFASLPAGPSKTVHPRPMRRPTPCLLLPHVRVSHCRPAPPHLHPAHRYVAYPAIFARPGYGSLAPLVLGVTLFGVVSTGECLFTRCRSHLGCNQQHTLGTRRKTLRTVTFVCGVGAVC